MSWEPGMGPLRGSLPPAIGFSTEDRRYSVDAVVVGGGPGGAAAARAMAKGGMKVLLVEEGPPESRFRPNQGHTMRYHMQEGGAMVALGAAPLPIAAGRGLGGGSLINSAIAWRCPDPVLESWIDRLGDDRFAPAKLRPVYDQLWEMLGIWPTRTEISGNNNDLIVRGVRALGLEGGYLERATPGCSGCGVCYFGCPSRGKASVDGNLLVDATGFGLQIQADLRIDHIEVSGDRVRGVAGTLRHPDSREPGGRVQIDAGIVVIAAGGIGTPRLLHHAGLADRLGPVGHGLHVHPGSAVLGRCEARIDWWIGATQGAWFHVPELPGVLPHTFSAPPEAYLAASGLSGPATKAAIAELPYLCGMVIMVSDTGEGRVGAWPDGRAKISYDFAESDVERIKRGMVWVAKVLLAGGAVELRAPIRGVPACTSAEALEAALADRRITDFTLYASHPMSSCRMGRDPASSVIGPDGQAHGLRGLYLADSSIFPTSLGVNPSLTTMAMAQVIGEGIARSS